MADAAPDAPVEWPEVDPATIAPTTVHKTTRVVCPDLYNYMPTRVVTHEEALARGWTYYFDGKKKCNAGHVSPRFASNPRMCVDCHRMSCGKPTIAEEKVEKKAEKKTKGRKAPRPTMHVYKDQVADVQAQRFLAAYAEMRDVEGAAKAVNWTSAKVEARIASDRIFREACDRLGLKIAPKPQSAYEWSDEKHQRLIEVFIDTGDLAAARDSIGVTPSEFFREKERNKAFAAALEDAEPKATQALEERAVQLALGGNDRLLQKILTAKKPEYRESLKVDVNQTVRLSDEQLNARLVSLMSKVRGQIVDAEFEEVDAPVLPAPVTEET